MEGDAVMEPAGPEEQPRERRVDGGNAGGADLLWLGALGSGLHLLHFPHPGPGPGRILDFFAQPFTRFTPFTPAPPGEESEASEGSFGKSLARRGPGEASEGSEGQIRKSRARRGPRGTGEESEAGEGPSVEISPSAPPGPQVNGVKQVKGGGGKPVRMWKPAPRPLHRPH